MNRSSTRAGFSSATRRPGCGLTDSSMAAAAPYRSPSSSSVCRCARSARYQARFAAIVVAPTPPCTPVTLITRPPRSNRAPGVCRSITGPKCWRTNSLVSGLNRYSSTPSPCVRPRYSDTSSRSPMASTRTSGSTSCDSSLRAVSGCGLPLMSITSTCGETVRRSARAASVQSAATHLRALGLVGHQCVAQHGFGFGVGGEGEHGGARRAACPRSRVPARPRRPRSWGASLGAARRCRRRDRCGRASPRCRGRPGRRCRSHAPRRWSWRAGA